jgi:hypothetical protein
VIDEASAGEIPPVPTPEVVVTRTATWDELKTRLFKVMPALWGIIGVVVGLQAPKWVPKNTLTVAPQHRWGILIEGPALIDEYEGGVVTARGRYALIDQGVAPVTS